MDIMYPLGNKRMVLKHCFSFKTLYIILRISNSATSKLANDVCTTGKEGFTILLLAGNCYTEEENLIQLFLLLRFCFALSTKCHSFQM